MSDICVETEKKIIPNETKKKSLKKRDILGIQQVKFCDSSGNPLASAWDLKIVYIPVEFLGKSRALCALKTMAYGDQLPNCATKRWEGLRASNGLHQSCIIQTLACLLPGAETKAGWRYAATCLLSHSCGWKKIAATPLIISSNNCSQFLQIFSISAIPRTS